MDASTEALAGLDFDHEVPCEWPEHGKPAKYLLITPCGCPALLCCGTCRRNHESHEPAYMQYCTECFAWFRHDETRMVPLP